MFIIVSKQVGSLFKVQHKGGIKVAKLFAIRELDPVSEGYFIDNEGTVIYSALDKAELYRVRTSYGYADVYNKPVDLINLYSI